MVPNPRRENKFALIFLRVRPRQTRRRRRFEVDHSLIGERARNRFFFSPHLFGTQKYSFSIRIRTKVRIDTAIIHTRVIDKYRPPRWNSICAREILRVVGRIFITTQYREIYRHRLLTMLAIFLRLKISHLPGKSLCDSTLLVKCDRHHFNV